MLVELGRGITARTRCKRCWRRFLQALLPALVAWQLRMALQVLLPLSTRHCRAPPRRLRSRHRHEGRELLP